MLTERIIIGERFAHNIENDINAGSASEFNRRDIVAVVADQDNLIDKMIIGKCSNVDTDLHVNTFLRHGQEEILVSQTTNIKGAGTQFFDRRIIKGIYGVVSIKDSHAQSNLPLAL